MNFIYFVLLILSEAWLTFVNHDKQQQKVLLFSSFDVPKINILNSARIHCKLAVQQELSRELSTSTKARPMCCVTLCLLLSTYPSGLT